MLSGSLLCLAGNSATSWISGVLSATTGWVWLTTGTGSLFHPGGKWTLGTPSAARRAREHPRRRAKAQHICLRRVMASRSFGEPPRISGRVRGQEIASTTRSLTRGGSPIHHTTAKLFRTRSMGAAISKRLSLLSSVSASRMRKIQRFFANGRTSRYRWTCNSTLTRAKDVTCSRSR